jgi:hypothetical protein
MLGFAGFVGVAIDQLGTNVIYRRIYMSVTLYRSSKNDSFM